MDINEIKPNELHDELRTDKKDLIVIDVRENEEVEQGMIPEAKHIPLQQIPDSLNELESDKDYVMVCRSGKRSMQAAMHLKEHGYKVRNMAGGMLEWEGDVKA
ncbi:rhodanese-like domain-containing protein [Oceanobacillus manasiensis]|uniref:rhodanese-like domain-containing protein n=1 Tax=Oceanobacillus manasiensis TaxID=586413 RepID=UPI0009FED39B|nr:rhodanese-like domain-containing protein [Oceanobacillus manasiensis]